MHACMIHMLTTRLAPHDRLMCSQTAARQCSLHTLDINGYTSRGPLHSMVGSKVPTACRGAMASIALPHVLTETDRQINLSQRVLTAQHAL